MDVIRKEVEAAAEKELENALHEHGTFASYHEKIAVVLEELQEAKYELERCEQMIKYVWDGCKADSYENQKASYNNMYRYAINLAVEACQVAAMCRKEVQSEERTLTEDISPERAAVVLMKHCRTRESCNNCFLVRQFGEDYCQASYPEEWRLTGNENSD